LKPDRQREFVVGGYRPGDLGVDALLVDYYERQPLRFAAKVRAGLTPHLRRALFERLQSLHCASPVAVEGTPHDERARAHQRGVSPTDEDAGESAHPGCSTASALWLAAQRSDQTEDTRRLSGYEGSEKGSVDNITSPDDDALDFSTT